MKRIQSADNSIWKSILKLRTRKGREESGCYLVEGLHLMEEALKCDAEIRQIIIRSSFTDSRAAEQNLPDQWEEKLRQRGIPVIAAADALFDKLSDTETPQGVLCVVKKNDWPSSFIFRRGSGTPGSNILVLDRIQDPGNLGTLFRTADAAGYGGVMILKGTADIYSPKVVRSAAGSLFRLPVCFVNTPGEAAALLKKEGKRILVTDPHGGKNYFDVPLRENAALVIGNEAGGVCGELLEAADTRVIIPMAGNIESLNAAIAAAVLMYESVRQWMQQPT